MNFSAVILAGGQSSRMGRDKAWLELNGQPLIARQIACARAAGASEVFISGRPHVDYSSLACPILEDEIPDLGPLAGIARALNAIKCPLLLVLAVDMSAMTSDFLKRLYSQCGPGVGTIPQIDQTLEPLAAFYPKSSARLLPPLLTGANPSHTPGAKHFAQACLQAGLAQVIPLSPTEAALFQSWNTPADVPPENFPTNSRIDQ